MEIPQLGDRCFVSSCAQLDFLPVKCSHCSQNFCKDHSFPSNHECPNVPDNTVTELTSTIESYKCSYDTCTEKEVMELLCNYCKKHFCVSHRHHGCDTPRREAQRARRERFEAPKRQFKAAKEAVNKIIDAKIEKNRNLTGAKQETANKIQVMRLKQKATGRRNVPESLRVYFLIHWIPNGATDSENKAVFVSKDWPLGRVVDNVADSCKILTDPNPTAPKLRLFHMNGEILTEDMATPLQKLLEDKVTIDGASLIVDFYSVSEKDETPTEN